MPRPRSATPVTPPGGLAQDFDLARATQEFRRTAEDGDWRRRAIRVVVRLDRIGDLRADFEEGLSDAQAAVGLGDDLANRIARAAWETHQNAAAAYLAKIASRLGWLARSGAHEAALWGVAEEVDRAFGSPLSPGDFAVQALHFGTEQAEQRQNDWRTAVGALIAQARRAPRRAA